MADRGGGDPRQGGATRRDGPAAGPRQGGTRADRDAARGGGRDPGAETLLNLPDQLAEDWEVEREFGAGGAEASLLLVRGRNPENRNQRRVVKIYHPNVELNPEVMRLRRDLDPAHIVRLYEHFSSGGREIEVLEYVTGGSLHGLLEQRNAALAPEEVDRLIAELCDALAALEAVEIVHRDLKPGNILLRSQDPLDLVLTDFGIASYLDGGSRRETTGSRTQSYAPPEAIHFEVSHATDWWSLGIIIVEVSTGRHPFAREGSRELISNSQMSRRLLNEDVELLVEGVNERWLLLCRGLLRRETGNRWGLSEVRRWLAGDRSMPVHAEQAPGRPPFSFAGTGREHYTIPEVARVLSEHWTEAMESFGRGDLQDWLERASDREHTLEAVRQIEQAYRRNAYPLSEAVFRTIVTMDPAIRPSCRGYTLDDRGIRRLCDLALEGDQAAARTVEEMLERGYLATYAELRGRERYREIEELWHNELDSFVALSPFVPDEGRETLVGHLPMAAAAGLRAVVSEPQWIEENREAALAARSHGRFIPRWYRTLEARIPRFTTAALVGLRALHAVAGREAQAEAQRRREAQALLLRQSFTASRLGGIILIVLLALFGIATLLGIR